MRDLSKRLSRLETAALNAPLLDADPRPVMPIEAEAIQRVQEAMEEGLKPDPADAAVSKFALARGTMSNLQAMECLDQEEFMHVLRFFLHARETAKDRYPHLRAGGGR